MIRVVIESPLRGDFERNRRYAVWCAYHCFTEAAYASHLMFPFFLDDELHEHREFGIEAGYSWANCADIIAFYLDLGMSEGMKRARKQWEGRVTDDRELPEAMLSAFNKGYMPPFTQGYEI
jgi:hypothetical protein